MFFSNLARSLLRVGEVQAQTFRYGHQLSTKWIGRQVRPKRRGIKCYDGEQVHPGRILVVQNHMRIFPGANVAMNPYSMRLIALANGTIKFTCEVFDPNFDHPLVVDHFGHRKGQKIYKKYISVITEPQHNRYKLVDVI